MCLEETSNGPEVEGKTKEESSREAAFASHQAVREGLWERLMSGLQSIVTLPKTQTKAAKLPQCGCVFPKKQRTRPEAKKRQLDKTTKAGDKTAVIVMVTDQWDSEF